MGSSKAIKRQLGVLSSGQIVIDRPTTHIESDMEKILPNILSKISVTKEDIFIERTITRDELLLQSKVVEIQARDKIFFAKRLKRFGLSKFVEGKSPEKTNSVTIVLKQNETDSNTYILITAYAGIKAGLEPYDKRARESDREYWRTHAFISELTEFDPNTVTDEVPKYFE